LEGAGVVNIPLWRGQGEEDRPPRLAGTPPKEGNLCGLFNFLLLDCCVQPVRFENPDS